MTANTLHHALGVAMLAAIAIGSAIAGNQARNEHVESGHFDSMDGNGDGVISASEHAAGAATMFNSMDADKDGVVTAAEMETLDAGGHVGKHAGKQVAGDDGGTPSGGGRGFSSSEKIAVLDQDGDGKLSQAEHSIGAKSMFAKSDTNLDSSLSPSEMSAARASMLKND